MKKAAEILNEKLPNKYRKYVNYGKVISCMEEYAKQFWPAEIIKNGNVNLKPIKTGIDWVKICIEFKRWKMGKNSDYITITKWFEERIEKELNQ